MNWNQVGFLSPRTAIDAGEIQFAGVIARATRTSTAWAAANLAIFSPIIIEYPCIVKQLFVGNGAAVSGNIDVGLYAEDGTRIVSSGSTAQAGTTTIQVFNVTDTYIGPGLYYIGVALDNTTGTVEGVGTSNIAFQRVVGEAEQTSAFPLPAIATLASMATSALMPHCGLSVDAVL